MATIRSITRSITRPLTRNVIFTNLTNWILSTGFWRDAGEWVDSETWND